MGRKKGAPSKFEATSEQRKLVEKMVAMGISQAQVAGVLNFSVDTLQKHFREELDNSIPKANAAVAGALYQNAIRGNVTAQIFWLKTRAGWREVDPTQEGDKKVEKIILEILPKT